VGKTFIPGLSPDPAPCSFFPIPYKTLINKPDNIMTRFILAFFIPLLCASFFLTAQQSGTVTYEITRRVDGRRVKIITSDGSNWTEETPTETTSMVVNLVQQLLFTPGLGKLSAPEPAMEIPHGTEMKIVRPFEELTFIDFNSERYLKYLKAGQGQDSTAYFMEEPFEKAGAWKLSNKTKEILGYECRKATAEWEGRKYTLWYTEDLGLTFSPVNGLLPEKGFVLAIEGDDMAYQATGIELHPVAAEAFLPPAPAQAVDAEGYKTRKKQMIEKLGAPGMRMMRMGN
jgi:GLPGLI family protein